MSRKNREKLYTLIWNWLKTKFRYIYRFLVGFVDRRPVVSFLGLLAVLFLLIIAGNLLRKPKPEVQKPAEVKKVQTYQIGSAPKVSLQGQIEKAGVVQVTSLMPGVVQNIYVTEGATVSQGSWLVSMSSNYQGGNSLTLARQLAEKQNELVETTYPTQKDLVGKQRDLANNNQSNFEKLRDITNQSVNDTQNLINLNNDIISTLDNSITSLQNGGGTATDILPLQQVKSQFSSANLQLNNQLRQAQYQTDTDNPATQLAQSQKDITLKQLDIQDKSLDLNREISKLSLSLARVSEAAMFPSAPFAARVEHIYVRQGQQIGGNTPLVTLSAVADPPLTINVYTSKEISEKVSRTEAGLVTIGGKTLELTPTYISQEATQGNLYDVMYTLPQDQYGAVTDKGFVTVQMPVGTAQTSASVPYIPLDTVYQTQEQSFVYVISEGKAKAKQVDLGPVTGGYVEVVSGLASGDTIIMDRTVTEGDKVETQ